jgi:hypothetical protein
MAGLAWRLHPPEAVNDLILRAKDSLFTSKERLDALTGLAFINSSAAAGAMVTLAKSTMKDVS